MTNEQFTAVYYPKYQAVITAIARKLARNNDALFEDLQSEGAIALWKIDPSKARGNVDAYIRQSIKYRLIDYIRKERPALFDSLTPYLDGGAQLVQDEDTHEPRLLLVQDAARQRRGGDDIAVTHDPLATDQDDPRPWEE